jgi:signal peptidase I
VNTGYAIAAKEVGDRAGGGHSTSELSAAMLRYPWEGRSMDLKAVVRKYKSLGAEPRGFIADWVVTIVFLLFGISAIAQPFVIPSPSMEVTLLTGDHVLVDKLVYAPPGPISKYLLPYEPVQRGDIIVFRYPMDINQNYVKRCIGVPGDHIRIVNKDVYLNGKKLYEPYAIHRTSYILPYRDNFPSQPDSQVYDRAVQMLQNNVVNGEVVVPPGNYFAMGDNRDNSLDSRYWGFVPRENIVGTPFFIWWSYDAPTEELASGNIDIGHIVDIVLHFFTKTRWNRTFRLVHRYPVGA